MEGLNKHATSANKFQRGYETLEVFFFPLEHLSHDFVTSKY